MGNGIPYLNRFSHKGWKCKRTSLYKSPRRFTLHFFPSLCKVLHIFIFFCFLSLSLFFINPTAIFFFLNWLAPGLDKTVGIRNSAPHADERPGGKIKLGSLFKIRKERHHRLWLTLARRKIEIYPRLCLKMKQSTDAHLLFIQKGPSKSNLFPFL